MGVVAPGNKQIGTYNITLLKRSDKTVKLGAVSSTALVKYNQPPVSIRSASGFALVQRFEQRNENVYHPTNYGLNNTVV